MKLALAFLCAASAFPAMLFESFKPMPPPPEKIAWQHDETWYHNYKNLWTETIKSHEQWWGKFLAFVICVLALLAVLT